MLWRCEGKHNVPTTYLKLVETHTMDPTFLLDAFPLDDELVFYLKNDLLIKKMTWSRHLFLFYF